MWEAADVQWWWCKPQVSDEVEQLFWLDEQGPVDGVLLTGSHDSWQCDPIIVPCVAGTETDVGWGRALDHGAKHAQAGFDVAVSSGDVFAELAPRSGLTPGNHDRTGWMHADDRPALRALPDELSLRDRRQHHGVPHHMHERSGDLVEQRLQQCSLYDPGLDLLVESPAGRVAVCSLYWFDPSTKVGLVEPVRVEDAYRRGGLVSAMLSTGIDRLVGQRRPDLAGRALA